VPDYKSNAAVTLQTTSVLSSPHVFEDCWWPRVHRRSDRWTTW